MKPNRYYIARLYQVRLFKDQINEWANMTGFLCALGGVCLQRKSPSRASSSLSNNSIVSTSTVSSMGTVSSIVDSRKSSVMAATATAAGQEQRQYCPVTQ